MLSDRAQQGRLRVVLLSLEPWDEVWRRNQHLSAQLVRGDVVSAIDYLEPPMLRGRPGVVREPLYGVRAVPLTLHLPKRLGGLVELGWRLRHGILREADVLWVNDPAVGVHCLRRGQPVLYDVTDDWRSYDFPPRIRRRIMHAEDLLARRARTVVCSVELQDRWMSRYGIEAAVVHNGVDAALWREPEPRRYAGDSPHVGYVGTLQPERLDVGLVLRVASHQSVGTMHLIGPDALDEASRTQLRKHPKVRLHPPVRSRDVPSWTVGLDVLLSPHVVTPFTLSLDAIKSYEYLASGQPIVATPTSGFQLLVGRPGVHIVQASGFADAIPRALLGPRPGRLLDELSWEARAKLFAQNLLLASQVTG